MTTDGFRRFETVWVVRSLDGYHMEVLSEPPLFPLAGLEVRVANVNGGDSTVWTKHDATVASLLAALEKISRAGTLDNQPVIDGMRAAIALGRRELGLPTAEAQAFEVRERKWRTDELTAEQVEALGYDSSGRFIESPFKEPKHFPLRWCDITADEAHQLVMNSDV